MANYTLFLPNHNEIPFKFTKSYQFFLKIHKNEPHNVVQLQFKNSPYKMNYEMIFENSNLKNITRTCGDYFSVNVGSK